MSYRSNRQRVFEATVAVEEQLLLEAGRKAIAEWDGKSRVDISVNVSMTVEVV